MKPIFTTLPPQRRPNPGQQARSPRLHHATVACALTLSGLAGSGAFAKSPQDPQIAGDILVRLHSTAALQPLLAKYPVTLASQFGARPIYRLRTVGSAKVDATIEAMLANPDVIDAEPNFVHRAPEARKNNVWAIGSAAAYTTQWAPAALRLADAQKLSTGAGIRVAVLDTGIDTHHPALAGKLLPGYDFVDGDNDPSERGNTSNAGFGHGTHVAGLVALAAPGARIVPLRVLDPEGQGNVWVLSQALLHAVDPDGNPATDDGAQVVNLSLGTLDRTRILDGVMKLAACAAQDPAEPADDFTDPGYNGDKDRCKASSGAVIVAAAGNDASNSVKEYPAAEGVYGLLPVGASAQDHRLASFSNSGSWVKAAAPGDRITSTVPGGGYGTWSGTSMAAPLASGAAALLRALAPGLKPVDVARRLADDGARLCDKSNLVQIDAYAALKNVKPSALICP